VTANAPAAASAAPAAIAAPRRLVEVLFAVMVPIVTPGAQETLNGEYGIGAGPAPLGPGPEHGPIA
jgi:hypothetical protein